MLTTKRNNISTSEYSEKTMPRLINGMIFLALLYLLIQLGIQVFNILQPSPDTPPAIEPNIAEKPNNSANSSDEIASLHLFGQTTNEEAAVDTEEKEIIAPETQLNLTLRGILAETDKQRGHAIIQNNDTSEESFFLINTSVFDAATLEEIYQDRVILLHKGNYETLYLPKEALAREHFSNRASIIAERKAIATDYRKRFLESDGDDLMTLFGFDTAYKQGGFIGFTVKALGEEGLQMMETLGIEDGDLITVLNGMRFSESLEALEQIKDLKTATSVDVIIERHGNEIPFHFELERPVETASTTPTQTTASDSPTYDLSFGGSSGDSAPPVSSDGLNASTQDPAVSNDAFDDDIEEDEELGEDWDESPEAIEYMEQQRLRKTGINRPVEFDH